METYKITYPSIGITQFKVLIPHYVYQTYISLPQETKEQESYAKGLLNKFTNGMEWFTEKSPFYESISTCKHSCNLKKPIDIIIEKVGN